MRSGSAPPLLSEEAAVQAYLDVAAVAIRVLDRQGRVTLINRRGCEILGLPAGEVLGRPWIDSFVAEQDRNRVRDAWARVVAGDEGAEPFHTIENLVVTSSGEERLVSWRTKVLRQPDGSLRAAVSSGEDVTERRNAERRLRAQESLARVGQLAAIVAHEVRNPLAGIRGAIQILSRRLPEGEDRRVMDSIVGRVDALNALTEDLLVYARPRRPEFAPVRLESVLGVARRLFAGHAESARVDVQVGDTEVSLEADDEMLQDVFLNLFLNAAQCATGPGVIRVEAHPGPDEVRVTVEDDGPGVPPDVRDRLFEPFFTTRHQGTGLGLPIVKRDVEAHGGDVALACPPKGGARVTITLPLRQRGD